jgi:hypothetical protein
MSVVKSSDGKKVYSVKSPDNVLSPSLGAVYFDRYMLVKVAGFGYKVYDRDTDDFLDLGSFLTKREAFSALKVYHSFFSGRGL